MCLRPLRKLLLLLLRRLATFLSTALLPRPMFGVDTLRCLLGLARLFTRSCFGVDSLDLMASGRKKPVPAGLPLALLLCGESLPLDPTSLSAVGLEDILMRGPATLLLHDSGCMTG